MSVERMRRACDLRMRWDECIGRGCSMILIGKQI